MVKLGKTRHAANVKDGLFAWGVDSQFEAKRCSHVARAAFAVCPNNPHQVLILQMARWWHRDNAIGEVEQVLDLGQLIEGFRSIEQNLTSPSQR